MIQIFTYVTLTMGVTRAKTLTQLKNLTSIALQSRLRDWRSEGGIAATKQALSGHEANVFAACLSEKYPA